MPQAITPASQILARHQSQFSQQRVLFAGDLQDDYPAQLPVQQRWIWCTQFHHYQQLATDAVSEKYFALLPQSSSLQQCQQVIYYWPKNKREAQFQLNAILAELAPETPLWIVGENRAGVRGVESLLAKQGYLQKVDTARRCSLYLFTASQPTTFKLADWWQQYQYRDLLVQSLPGVFSAAGLDAGSELLLNTLQTEPLQGELLDIGCGAGVLAACLGQANPQLRLTLCDTSAAAIAASEATLAANQLTGRVLASDVFSAISGKFELIISNPPFHDGRQTDYRAAEALIRQVVNYLKPGGKLYLVANAFLAYPQLLDDTFGSHQVLAQNSRFKVYQAIR